MRTYASDRVELLVDLDGVQLTDLDGTYLLARAPVGSNWGLANLVVAVPVTPVIGQSREASSGWSRHADVVAVPPSPVIDLESPE